MDHVYYSFVNALWQQPEWSTPDEYIYAPQACILAYSQSAKAGTLTALFSIAYNLQ